MTPPPPDQTTLDQTSSSHRTTSPPIEAASEKPARKRSSKRMIWIGVIVVVLAAAALVFGLNWWSASGPAARRQRPTVTVGTAQATKGDVPIIVDALGTATPASTVTVNARVSGNIVRVNFKEGDRVKAGQVLAEVDPRPYQAALDQAKGQLKRDEALLANARTDAERYQTLLKEDSVSRQQADTQAALVKQDEGVVATDNAAVEAAQLNLSYTKITAPISGRAGLRLIDAGNYIAAGGTSGIVVLTQTQPMDVVFSLPEDQAPVIAARVRAGATLEATALDRAGAKEIAKGTLSTLDNVIDVSTGTVRAKARFNNDDEALLANQFVNIHLLADTLKDAVIVPAASIRQGPNGAFVWILKSDKTASMRQVKLGPANGEQASIADGVQVGETVITEGGDNLREGAPVTLQGQRGGPRAGGQGRPGGGQGGQHGHRGQGGRPGGDPNAQPGGPPSGGPSSAAPSAAPSGGGQQP